MKRTTKKNLKNNNSADSINNLLKDKGTLSVPLSLFKKHFILLPDLTLSRQQTRDLSFAFFTEEKENEYLTNLFGVTKKSIKVKTNNFPDAPVVLRNTNLFAATMHDIDSLIDIDDETNEVDFGYLKSWILSLFIHRFLKEVLIPASLHSRYIASFVDLLNFNKRNLSWLHNPIPFFSDKQCNLNGFEKCFNIKFFLSPKLIDSSLVSISKINNESIFCNLDINSDQIDKCFESNEIDLDKFLSEIFLYDPTKGNNSKTKKKSSKSTSPQLLDISQHISHHIYCSISLNIDRIDEYVAGLNHDELKKFTHKVDGEHEIIEKQTKSYIPGFYYCSNQYVPMDPTHEFEHNYNEFIKEILYQTFIKNNEYMNNKKKDELSLPRNFEELVEYYYDTAYFNAIGTRVHEESLKYYQPSKVQVSLEFQPKQPDRYLPLQLSVSISAE